jgi:uncharacterized protein (TIGR00645 family)
MLKFPERVIEWIVFASRWVQAPMYLGLIFASMLYCYRFMIELRHFYHELNHLDEDALMLALLGLVDVTMVANLVYMVVVGGYSLFVSRMSIEDHPDRPEWLEKTNAATLKIKLASSLVGVSGIHLLKTFIQIETKLAPGESEHVKWRVIIHVVFLFSALILAFSERVLYGQSKH